MSSRHDGKRKNVEGDRLSSLPDNLIHKILSFISLQQAIGTSTLSSRWRYIWTSMPYLNFSTESFSTLSKFSEFVTNILSRHKYQVQLSSVKLSFPGKATQVFVKRILNYASSHNVEQLTVVSVSNPDNIKFPINHLSSQSRKHLMLTRSSGLYSYDVLSLEKVDLTISYPHKAQTIVVLLQQLRRVKFLRLNLEILELFSSSVELISHQPSPFANLKSLKIYQFNYNIGNRAPKKVNVSAVIENYFLDNSPSATLTLVLREEIRAHRLTEKLQGLLKQWKGNGEKNTAHIDQGDVENQRAQQQTIKESHFGEKLTRIKGYWSDLNKWYEEENEMACHIISLLQKIEKLLTKLPASQRAKMQPMYSSLNAEAETFINNMMDSMRILCDKQPRSSNVYLS
ncbi:F-box domain containing protein [Tanacetum coccineum]